MSETCKTLGQHLARLTSHGYCGCGHWKAHDTANQNTSQPTALPKQPQPAAHTRSRV